MSDDDDPDQARLVRVVQGALIVWYSTCNQEAHAYVHERGDDAPSQRLAAALRKALFSTRADSRGTGELGEAV